MKFLLALIAAAVMAGSAVAQHAHGDLKGPNGGPMEDVAGVHAELLVSGATVTLNIFDEDSKPIPTKGFSASALVASGGDRETFALTASGDNALQGNAKKPVAASAAVTVTLKTAAGKSGQAKFKR